MVVRVFLRLQPLLPNGMLNMHDHCSGVLGEGADLMGCASRLRDTFY
jgi:hypothetical protein